LGNLAHYVIRGGVEGRERLRLISRLLQAGTAALCERAGIADGMWCIDVGCGGGDVTTALARRVGPRGKVIGIDIDTTKIEIARREAEAHGLGNLEFVVADIRDRKGEQEFDAVYSRFVLTHLPDPEDAIERFYRWLRPGGLVVLEDIDCSGYFVFPELPAFRRYHNLYCEVVRRRGGDPNIGSRLPRLLKRAGFADVSVGVTQPIGLEGDVKLLNAITLENVADTIIEASLASREELDELVRELYAYAADPETLAGAPRIVQAWGRRPVND
jgi:SAM-dependent methyltransferase